MNKKINTASASLITRIDNATSAVNLKTTLEGAYGELVTANNIGTYTSGFVTTSDLNSAVAQMVAKDDYNAATIVAMVNEAGSSIELDADKINFTFTQSWNVKAKNHGTVLSLDTDGNLTLTGELKNCNVNGTLNVGNGNNNMKIIASTSGAELAGYVGSSKCMSLGFYTDSYHTTPSMKLSFNNSFIGDRDGQLRWEGLDSGGVDYLSTIDYRMYNGLSEIEFYTHKNGYYVAKLLLAVSNGKALIRAYDYGGDSHMWPTSPSEVSIGGVYLDGNVLKVKTSY